MQAADVSDDVRFFFFVKLDGLHSECWLRRGSRGSIADARLADALHVSVFLAVSALNFAVVPGVRAPSSSGEGGLSFGLPDCISSSSSKPSQRLLSSSGVHLDGGYGDGFDLRQLSFLFLVESFKLGGLPDHFLWSGADDSRFHDLEM